MSFKVLLLISLTFCIQTKVEGYAAWCDVNQTSFVTEGSTATFRAYYSTDGYFRLWLKRRSPVYRVLAYARNSISTGNFTVDFVENNWSKRTLIIGRQCNESQMEVTIAVSDISMSDNGTYTIKETGCWLLFVMQISQEPRSVTEENKPVYIYAHPHTSLITCPLVNATMVWLLDGLSANQSGSFIQYDGFIWIAHVRRDMSGRNVTYRAIQDNGAVNEVNHTLNFTYGPSQPLTLIPEKKQYYLTSGDLMPDITCNADCHPPCLISWGEHSPGSTLSLGRVTIDDIGDYSCIATRDGVDTVVKETINIFVADNTIVTIAIAVLASVQASVILVLCFCAFCIYKRNQGTIYERCFKAGHSPGSTEDGSTQTTVDGEKSSGVTIEQYEDLNTETRQTSSSATYGQINLPMSGNRVGKEFKVQYENIAKSVEDKETYIT